MAALLDSSRDRFKSTARRNRVNRAFLLACLAVTSLSVLMLSVLIAAIFVQGTRELFGFQLLVVPSTERLVEAQLDTDAREIAFRYAPADPTEPPPPATFLYPPGSIDLEGANLERTDDAVRLELGSGERIRVAGSGGLLSRITVFGTPSFEVFWDFIAGNPSSTPHKAGFRAPLIGSLWLLAVCAIAAIPLGVGTAIVLEESRPKHRVWRALHGLVQTNIRNLAGVPSVVYGLIGLTVFARMFGAFGSPGQFTAFEEIRLADGTVILGQVTDDRRERTFRMTTDLFGSIEFTVDDERIFEGDARGIRPGDTIDVTGTIDLDPDTFNFVVSTNEAGTFRLDAALATALDEAILFEDPFQERTIDSGSLTFVGEGELVVESPEDGRLVIDKSRIKDMRHDRDDAPVRRHTFTFPDGATVERLTGAGVEPVRLAAGERLSGASISLDDGTIILREKRGDEAGVRFTTSQSTYQPHRRFELGDEDGLFFVTLPFGTSVLAGGLTLMLVILPVVIIASQESLRAVPDSLREGALALGATRLQMIGGMTLPSALPGILTGAILAMSRAIGEAAPILIIGGAAYVTSTPDNLMSDFAAMPLQIYSWTGDANNEFKAVAASGIIVLLTVLLLFNGTAIVIRQKLRKDF
jgi:phosphate transport system permease protein